MVNQWRLPQSLNRNAIPVSAFTADEIADTIVAMSNTNGGLITDLLPLDSNVIVDIAKNCTPPIEVEIKEFAKTIVACIPRSKQIHATSDGRVLVRSKNENVQLNGEQIRHLAQMRGVGDYENEVVPGTSIADLDITLIENFCYPVGIDDVANTHHVLAEVGAIDENQRPTVAGILLFGESPQRWLPQSAVIIKRFAGKISDNGEAIQHQEIQGNLSTILATLQRWVVEKKPISTTDNIELPPRYPASVVIEALTNALIHREYRLRDRVGINIYDNAVQIVSPGKLPNFIKIASIESFSFYRNPNIAHSMWVWGYGQKMGSGIEQMRSEATSIGHTALHFTTERNHLIVSITQTDNAFTETNTESTSINWRQECAIRYIQECGSLTHHEFHALCPNIEKQTLDADLVDLVDKKLLVKVGKSRKVFFALGIDCL